MLATDEKFIERFPLAAERRFAYYVRVNPTSIRANKAIIVNDTPKRLELYLLRDGEEIDNNKLVLKSKLMKVDSVTTDSHPSAYVYCLEADLEKAIEACCAYVTNQSTRNFERAKKEYEGFVVLRAQYEEAGLGLSRFGELECRLGDS
ncbi:MAG: hypothetical protein ACRCTP_03830 [Aeromonas popoffii]|uniref:hypothetical protein n=1 Tax=Aeromonas popoffii TaxID=70856 RepID=UPI003F3AEC55